jgi:hypothetical protein
MIRKAGAYTSVEAIRRIYEIQKYIINEFKYALQ